MIICPECPSEIFLQAEDHISKCHLCGFILSTSGHTFVFHPKLSGIHNGLRADILDDVFSKEENHFWMRCRRIYIYSIFNKFVGYHDRIIEIGAGTGNMASFLTKKGYGDFSVGDVHIKALDYAKKYGVQNRFQFDLMETPFIEHFDIICMFDVLEHFDDDGAAIININKMLKKRGKLILTVPAHMWLWNKQDAIAYHRRRYELDQLRVLLVRNNFKILKSNYFFISLIPFLLLRRCLYPDKGNLSPDDFKNRFGINPALNYLLTKLLSLEVKLFKNISFKAGGSILIVAEKIS